MKLNFRKTTSTLGLLILCVWTLTGVSQAQGDPPQYPSRRGFKSESINTNDYGYYPWAKRALEIGDQLPDFSIDNGKGGSFDSQTPRDGDLVLIFYRGFW